MLFVENIKLAVNAIRINKMRSFLTMLGIIIGISSVIAISSIGASAQNAIKKEFNSMGVAGCFYLMPNWQEYDEITSDMMFTWEDIDALKARYPEDIVYIAPNAYESTKTKVGRVEADLSVSGVAGGYDAVSPNIQIQYGRMISKKDVDASRTNIVIPKAAALKLFGRENAVGETLPATAMGNAVDYSIVGVYDNPPSLFGSLNTDTSFTCYAPYSAISRSDWGTSLIEVYADSGKDVRTLAESFARYMEHYKGLEEGTYMYQSAEEQISVINSVLGYLSLAIGAIAAISLLVGGIGIMNIMLVSVTERTREIGIRKSLGARTKDILTQFLIEAMILSVIGGIIGTLLGIGIAAIGTTIAGVSLSVNLSSVLLAVAFSAGVGLFFGLFPARKAARLDPIEALRYE